MRQKNVLAEITEYCFLRLVVNKYFQKVYMKQFLRQIATDKRTGFF